MITVRLILPALILIAGCMLVRPIRQPPSNVRPPATTSASTFEIYWIGHATALIRIADKWIITDPVFSDSVGLLVKRFIAPGIDLDALPPVDLVLISHAHMDHLDYPSLERLNQDATIVTPKALHLSDNASFARHLALERWQSVEQDGVRITAVPVDHSGGRWGIDSLWSRAYAGFVVQYAGRTVLFAGDTAYDPELFTAIGERFDIDVALMPMGPTGGRFMRWMMSGVHTDPYDTMRALEDLDARWLIPIHHGTFYREGSDELSIIRDAIEQSSYASRVLLLEIGEVADFTYRNTELVSPPRDIPFRTGFAEPLR